MDPGHSDVLILGGGLAGLSLAIQLRREQPALRVRVLERLRHPAPAAAFKVGESTVEIGAHYFDTVLGLREHLEQAQLRKFGFRFFFSDGRDDVTATTELGVSAVFPTPSYQIDRGIFENFLALRAQELGAEFIDGATVRQVELAGTGAAHRVQYERDGALQQVQARWVIDAAGRTGLIKRRRGLEKANGHDANAAWFRVAARVSIDDWGDAAWRARCTPPERWRSTNHLCGPGYWVWMIPLASGSHSIGIVADARLHPLETYNSYDKAMDWLAHHQPRLHRALEPLRPALQDFRFLRHFSNDCAQVFSAERWAISGIAGLFLDPFYSPGSDYIAIANTYIADLIARDSRGEPIARLARRYEQLYFSFYRNTMALYEGQYPMFGHAQWMPVKVVWDYAYYWGVLCQFFFQQRLTDLGLFARLATPLARCEALNREVQALLRTAAGSATGRNDAQMLDQVRMPWFGELNRGLRDALDADALAQRIEHHAAMLEALAAAIRTLVATRADACTQALFDVLAAVRVEPSATLAAAS